MDSISTETEPEKYVFTCFFDASVNLPDRVFDFRAKTIDHAVGILTSLRDRAYRDLEEVLGAGVTRCIFATSIQCGELIWDNDEGRDDSLDAAFDLRKWRVV